jgi:hypothetical protein
MSLSTANLDDPAPLASGRRLRKLSRLRSGIHGVGDWLRDDDDVGSTFSSFFLRKMTRTAAMDTMANAPQIDPKTTAKCCVFDPAVGSTTTTEPELKCIFMISIPFRIGA